MIKVMIVEDDPMVAEFNKRYLEQVKGFELTAVCAAADEALDILKTWEIDLVLLDIYMPGSSGLDLLSKIREIGKSVDVIVITAASDIQSIKKALRLGAVDYLIKPFEFARFEAALTAYLEEIKIMKDQEKLSQTDLDRLILHKDHPTPAAALPKGLTRNTLKTVWEQILGYKGSAFSTDEIANRVGISRVSMRKYLNFMNEAGVLDIEIIYGSIGRPVYMHRSIPSKHHLIQPYL